MSVSGANFNQTSLSRGLQYERLAVFEAVLTLRDKRNRSRTQLAGIAVSAVATVALIAAYWM